MTRGAQLAHVPSLASPPAVSHLLPAANCSDPTVMIIAMLQPSCSLQIFLYLHTHVCTHRWLRSSFVDTLTGQNMRHRHRRCSVWTQARPSPSTEDLKNASTSQRAKNHRVERGRLKGMNLMSVKRRNMNFHHELLGHILELLCRSLLVGSSKRVCFALAS